MSKLVVLGTFPELSKFHTLTQFMDVLYLAGADAMLVARAH